MKRLIGVLLIVLVFTANAFAVESITWATYGDPIKGLQVKSTIVASATGTVTTTVLQDASGKTLSLMNYYLYSVDVYFGATAPTADSDLELLEHSATGYDILHGAGTDQIDAVTNSSFKPWINGDPSAMPIYGPLYQKVTQATEATANATFVIIYRFLPR